MYKKSIRNFFFCVVGALCATSGTVHAQANKEVSSAFSLGSPRLTTLIVETVYPMKIVQYKDPKTVPIRKRIESRSTANSPEDVVIDMLSSMKAKDFEWNSSLWTLESLNEMKKRDAAAGKKPSDWIRLWEKEKDRTFEFVTRIEYGKYVLIEYASKDASGKAIYKDTIATEKVGGKWYLTQALAADPVLTNWDNPTGRVQVAPDTLFGK